VSQRKQILRESKKLGGQGEGKWHVSDREMTQPPPTNEAKESQISETPKRGVPEDRKGLPSDSRGFRRVHYAITERRLRVEGPLRGTKKGG